MIRKFDSHSFFKLPAWIAGLAGVLFLFYSMDVLSRNIGVYWDEIWDYIPSVGLIRGDSLSGRQEINLFHHPVPLVSGPYHGALKTWLAAPLIQLFGGSPHFLLSLNVIFAIICLLALRWALSPAIARWAWIVFAWPLLDANFLLVAPMDFGPSLFQCIFISLAMGALFRYLDNPDGTYFRMIWFFSGCVLAQKLTAIPVVISLVAMTIVVSWKPFWKSAGENGWPAAIKSYGIVPASALLIPMIPHLLYFWKSGLTDFLSMTGDGVRGPYFASLVGNFKYVRSMFDGADWYQRITLDSPAPAGVPPVLFYCVLGLMLVSVVIFFASTREKKLGMHAAVSAALFLGSFLMLPAFKGLNRPWHFWILTPMFACCFILSGATCLSFLANRWRKSAIYVQGVFAACLALGIAYSAVYSFGILGKIDHRKGVCLTSPAITKAHGALRAANIKRIYGVNYSIAYPVYVLSKGAIRAEELAWTDLTKEKIEEMLNRVRLDPKMGMVYRFCGCKEGDQDWIRWLNRDPQIFDLMKRLESESATLDIDTIKDERETRFVIVRKK